MSYLFSYYGMLLNFMGNHPVFSFFTFPMWMFLVCIPFVILAFIVAAIIDFLNWLGKK